MGVPGDARCLALPCVLAAGVLQYLRFAKKPMAPPCHMVSERLSRRLVFLGLFIELAAVRILPLCEIYPMNASCLVILYFWRETKRSKSIHKDELLACASALSAWALPFVRPSGGAFIEAMPAALVLDRMLSPFSCSYVVALLVGSTVVHCFLNGGSALGSCAPPGLNFGVSALLLKAFTQVAASLAASPGHPEQWATLVVLAALLLGARSVATTPLRRALEAHDNLSVLAFYGCVSSAAAVASGALVFGELQDLRFNEHALFMFLGVAHCWGMHSLGRHGGERYTRLDGGEKEDRAEAPSGRALGKSVQMAELQPGHRAGAEVAASAPAKAKEAPLLQFNDEPVAHTVEDDEQFEDKLFAQALGACDLPTPVDGGGPDGWAADWGNAAPEGGAAGPQLAALAPAGGPAAFDADFEEMMKRFEEEDKAFAGTLPVLDFDSGQESSPPDSEPVKLPSLPQVLTYDAQTLLDASTGQDDEDELLRNIEDIPAP